MRYWYFEYFGYKYKVQTTYINKTREVAELLYDEWLKQRGGSRGDFDERNISAIYERMELSEKEETE